MSVTALRQAIESEPPGDYFIGRRFYKTEYKFWGFWCELRVVVLTVTDHV